MSEGCNQKFDYDPETKSFRLSKILPAGLVFPFDFGMIPSTKGADGDPLDIIVVSESGTFAGCQIYCRIIGALRAEQTERDGKIMRNDRFIGIPDVSQLFSEVNTLDELPEAILNQPEAFFKNYNEQAGKEFKVTARLSAKQAVFYYTKNNRYGDPHQNFRGRQRPQRAPNEQPRSGHVFYRAYPDPRIRAALLRRALTAG